MTPAPTKLVRDGSTVSVIIACKDQYQAMEFFDKAFAACQTGFLIIELDPFIQTKGQDLQSAVDMRPIVTHIGYGKIRL